MREESLKKLKMARKILLVSSIIVVFAPQLTQSLFNINYNLWSLFAFLVFILVSMDIGKVINNENK